MTPKGTAIVQRVLAPPFTDGGVLHFAVELPTVARQGDSLFRPRKELQRYLDLELKTPKLDKVYRHLHYAGLPRFARPLHRQKLMRREILVTQNVDEHLVWHQSQILVKPLNTFLLNEKFWIDNLCSDESIHRAACGFLLSYVWLVNSVIDFDIAKKARLLPEELKWTDWIYFTESFLENVDINSLHQVARRYRYGELRLSRLNRIYRFSPLVLSPRNFFRGFLAPSTWYQEYFRQHFGWLLAAFVYCTLALSGMQVGLMTDQLQGNKVFVDACFGFAVFSITIMAAASAILLATWTILAIYYYCSSKLYHHRVQSARRDATPNVV